jgi:Ca2+-binding EF-hand superfamily protein
MKKLILSAAALAALFATPVSAQRAQDGVRAGESVTRAVVETRVRERFARVDANRDGYVTQEEAQAFRATMRTQRQGNRAERRGNRAGNREAMFVRLDANRDGMISREEFNQPRAGMERGERHAMRAERRGPGAGGFGARAFTRLDTDRDSRISLAEATQARLRMFEQMDSDRDGRISPEERRARRAARDRG